MAEQNKTDEISHEDMDELKRDMRTAHLAAWAKAHQNHLIAAVAMLLLVVVSASVWTAHRQTQRESAATLYHQGLTAKDVQTKTQLMQSLARDYPATDYAAMALMQLSVVDATHAETHLHELLKQNTAPIELRWQAQLDLAQLYLSQHAPEKAATVLADTVGSHYEQLRQYLLAQAATTNTDKKQHYQHALDAVSHDAVLKEHIQQALAGLSS